MLATKLSISLDPYSLTLLNRVQQDYDCSNRSQAVVRVLKLYQDIVEQHALENAYTASSDNDSKMDTEFANTQLDGLTREAW